EAAGAVGRASNVPGAHATGRRFDLIVHLGAGDARRVEPHADLDPFHGGDGENGRADSAVELPVPRHVRAESDRQSIDHDLADAADSVAFALMVSMRAIMRASASASSVRSGDASEAALMSAGIVAGRAASIPPRCTRWLPIRTS